MRLKTLLIALVMGITLAHAQFVDAPKREYRAVWLTTIKGLDWPDETLAGMGREEEQKEALCTILDSLQGINIDTILLHPEPESNQRHMDFQSIALPTELSGHVFFKTSCGGRI